MSPVRRLLAWTPGVGWGPTVLFATLAALSSLLSSGCAAPGTASFRGDLRSASELSDAERLAQVRLELASAYFARGQSEVALDEVKRALAAKPDMAPAHELRGLVHAQLGEPVRADESFRRALQLAPGSADAMHNYGWFLCQQRRWAEAEVLFARALSQPGYRSVGRSLLAQGVCRGRAGHLDAARSVLARAGEVDPGSPAVRYALAEVMYLIGDHPGAHRQLAGLHADPDAVTPESLWLALRVDRRLGDAGSVERTGTWLLARFPRSSQARAYQEGRFDE
jgi:type IV pilus assembly protein PilF